MTGLNLPIAYYVFLIFVFGLIIGSFLNVVIHRLPRGESIVFPGSHCPACRISIRPVDNIPLISYLLLRRRCRNCHKPISPIYPLVELLTGLLFIAIFIKSGPGWEAVLEMIFASIMLALVFLDARHHFLPNVITYPAFLFALCAAIVRGGWGEENSNPFVISIIIPAFDSDFVAWRAALIGGMLLALAAPGFWLLERLDLILFNKYFEWAVMNDEAEEGNVEKERAIERRDNRVIYTTMVLGLLLAISWAVALIYSSSNQQQAFQDAYHSLLRASLGALISGGFIWWVRAVYFYLRGVEGMGLGDVKLMSIIGAFLGWQGILGVLLLGSILGVALGAILAFRSQRGLKTPLPFGACLGIASLIVMLTWTY